MMNWKVSGRKCSQEDLSSGSYIVLARLCNKSILDEASAFILVRTHKNYLNCLSTKLNERFDRI
jgi:hypothetical protein